MKKILSSTAVILFALGALLSGGTGAFFRDTELSSDNTFAAGAIDLKIDNTSYYNGVANSGTTWTLDDLTDQKFFDFSDLKPEDYGEDTISIHVDTNDAYICADVTLTSNDDNGVNEPEAGDGDVTDGAGNGELADNVNFIWWADDGDNVLESDENVISSGPIGALTLNTPYPVTLADSDENIWTGPLRGGGPVLGTDTKYIGKAWCFGSIDASPDDQDGVGDVKSPAGDNNGNALSGEPEDGGISCDGSVLNNVTQTDSLTADISFEAVQSRHNEDFQCDEPEIVFEGCETPTLAYADSVVSSSQGTRKNGTAILPDRTDPTDALGTPQSTGAFYDNPVVAGSFFSLGFKNAGATPGGNIIVEFTDNVIIDGVGNDLKVWEVTGGTSYPDEHVKIEVSQDGTNWFIVAADLTRDAEADLAVSGLTWAKFIRLTDISPIGPFESTADGYDLDAFSALNCGQVPA